jgi:stage V sporulation protein G
MQITEITIHPTNDGLVRSYASIVFDNCFMVGEIRVIQGLTGLFISFPAKKLTDGTPLGYRFSANSEARREDRASHNSGVREGRGPKAIYWQPQKSKHQVSRERVSEN